MLFRDDEVIFEEEDLELIRDLSIDKAAEKVLAFYGRFGRPYIFNGNQLADFFCIKRKEFYHTVRTCNRMYTDFTIPKQSGGCRSISAPKSRLEGLQHLILTGFLDKIYNFHLFWMFPTI